VTLTAADRAQYFEKGFLLLENLCGEVERYRSRVEEHLQGTDPLAVVRFGKGRTPIHSKISQLAERDEVFRELARNPRLVAAVEELIGPPLIFRDAVVAKPARTGTAIHYHQDAAYWDVASPERVLSAWIALDDAGEEAGCLRVVPGSHENLLPHGLAVRGRRLPQALSNLLRRAVSLTGTADNPKNSFQKLFGKIKNVLLGTATKLQPALSDLNDLHIDPRLVVKERVVSLPVRAGDAILFQSRLIHGSGPNQGQSPRRAYIVTYMSTECCVAGESSSRFLSAKLEPAVRREEQQT
jgi:ectoine hydroxylase-related dioxygenase (phytanoyl-CoA dioxygenase family)